MIVINKFLVYFHLWAIYVLHCERGAQSTIVKRWHAYRTSSERTAKYAHTCFCLCCCCRWMKLFMIVFGAVCTAHCSACGMCAVCVWCNTVVRYCIYITEAFRSMCIVCAFLLLFSVFHWNKVSSHRLIDITDSIIIIVVVIWRARALARRDINYMKSWRGS